MSQDVITTDDFLLKGQSLNMEGFIGHTPILTKGTILSDFPDAIILTPDRVNEFAKNVMEKAREAEEADVKDILEKARGQMSRLKAIRYQEDGQIHNLYLMEKSVGDDGDDLQKAHIDDAIGYADFGFTKTGKEIKEKLTPILANIRTKASGHLAEMQKCQIACGLVPAESLDEWETRGMSDEDIDLKKFSYDQTTYSQGTQTSYERSVESAGSNPNKDSAAKCREYNENLRKYLNCLKDENKANVFLRNCEDKKSVKLSLNQLAALGF